MWSFHACNLVKWWFIICLHSVDLNMNHICHFKCSTPRPTWAVHWYPFFMNPYSPLVVVFVSTWITFASQAPNCSKILIYRKVYIDTLDIQSYVFRPFLFVWEDEKSNFTSQALSYLSIYTPPNLLKIWINKIKIKHPSKYRPFFLSFNVLNPSRDIHHVYFFNATTWSSMMGPVNPLFRLQIGPIEDTH